MTPNRRSWLDGREVDRVEMLMTPDHSERAGTFLDHCVPGSTWTAFVRTARVTATVLARKPLGSFDERICTCVRLHFDEPVPLEPGLRFRIVADDDHAVTATGVVRPWDG